MRSLYPLLLLCLLAASCRPRPVYVQHGGSGKPQPSAAQPAAERQRPVRQQPDSGEVIGYADIPLTKAQPESTLGNFLADAMLAAARGADREVVAAVSNYGSIRVPYIAPGPISRSRLSELMPFNNKLVILDIPGAVLQQLCDVMAARRGWPVSGITFSIKDRQAAYVLVAGVPLNPALVYRVAVNDYMARGGDGCAMLPPLKRLLTGVLVRDA